MFSFKVFFALALFVGLSLAEPNSPQDEIRSILKEISKSKELIRDGRLRLDTLSANSKFSLSEILYIIQLPDELKVSQCKFSNQKLIEQFVATGIASEYLNALQGWLSRYCAAASAQTIQNGFEKLRNSNKLLKKSFNRKLMISSDDNFKEGRRISNRADNVDAEEAERILSSDLLLPPEVAQTLIKRLDPSRFSFALGKLGDLQRVAELNPKECHTNELELIFGKAMEFEEFKQAPLVFMQNLAREQFGACQSPGTSIVEKIAAKLPEESRKLVEELGEEAQRASGNEKGKAVANFDNVMEALKGIAIEKRKLREGEVFELYGKQLAAACQELVNQFKPYAKLINTFTDTSISPITLKWVLLHEYCRFVPERYDSEGWINNNKNVHNNYKDFGVELAKQLGVTATPNSADSLKKDKFLRRLAKHVNQFTKKEKNPLWSYMNAFKNNCDKDDHYKQHLLWMSRNGYPVGESQKLELLTISNMCDLVHQFCGVEELKAHVGAILEQPSTFSKIKSAFSRRNKNE